MEGAMLFGPCLSGPVALKSVPAFTNGLRGECSDPSSRACVWSFYIKIRLPEQVSQY